MRSVLPLSLLVGKTMMTILGSVSLSMRVEWVNAEPDSTTTEFLVVHRFPVPVHVSTHHPRMPKVPPDGIRFSDYPSFEAGSFPERFAEHEYWHSNTIFIGSSFMSGPSADDEDYELDGLQS
ncbi:hypothetical protein FGB62_190g07 [Gracilaria domingensis]|nr:hypothetical protein FGB62_190g07 [Gracilaria domingensis]